MRSERRQLFKLRAAVVVLIAWAGASAPAFCASPPCEPQTLVDVTVIKQQIVVIGETHGTVEIPRFTAQLICSALKAGRPVMLGIEHTSAEQGAINRYLGSDGSAADKADLLSEQSWHADDQYGLTSRAMLGLIDEARRLHRSGLRIGVLAFAQAEMPRPIGDQAPLSEADNRLYNGIRDREMADRILSATTLERGSLVVILTGFLHASTLLSKGGNGIAPMTYLLEQQQSVFTIAVTAPSVRAWVCTQDGCGPSTRRSGVQAAAETRVDALVELPALTPSSPAFQATGT
jgi:hypothetical protein